MKSLLVRMWRSEERGQALLLFAAALTALCGLVGMAVDVGHVVFTRTDLQKIADASALAGSQDLPGSTANATTSANTYAGLNGSATVGISFGNSNTTITVKATRHVDYTFLKVIGLSGRDVGATATARATQKPITGYAWTNIAPFVIWGGSQGKSVGADKNCPYHTCQNKSYTFLDTGWMGKNGNPSAPDWTASGSNNFKGDINHGDGNPISQIGETFSDGGLGSVTTPSVGEILVIPIVDKASGGSSNRTFHIAAWAIVKVDPGCRKQGCTGTVQGQTTTPPAGWDSSGPKQPPTGLTYTGSVSALTE